MSLIVPGADEYHCNECYKFRPAKKFVGYFRVSTEMRQHYKIAHIAVCDECLAKSHRPRQLRMLAGLIATTSSTKEKKGKKMQTKTVPPPRQTTPANGNGATPPSDPYPNVLPREATFIPVGFVRGEHTGLIIRRHTDPVVPPDSRCAQHSEIAGRDIYHPHWDFYYDVSSNRRNHLRSSCRALYSTTANQREKMKATWKDEHADQLEEGRRLEQLAAHDESEHVDIVPLSEPVPEEIVTLQESPVLATTTNGELPYTHLKDLRVILPEGFTAGTKDPSYMDFDIHPPQLAEIQRVGMFLTTQMVQALKAYHDLQILNRKYDQLSLDLSVSNQEVRALQTSLNEAEQGRSRLSLELQEALQQLRNLQSGPNPLQQELETLRESSAYDKSYAKLLEDSNAELVEKLKKIEQWMKPFLGGRTLNDMLADM